MTNIIGIPATRISDLFVRQRLMEQVQQAQKELFRAEMQVSTGRRFQLPSEEPTAALRAMSLQRLLERKEQVRTNLSTNQSYLSATDTAMSRISNLVAEMRGVAVGAVDTVLSQQQRLAAALQVQEAIRQLVDAGNQQFRGRYLFAGSTTYVRPFRFTEEGIVEYLGNEKQLLSYSDIDLLFETNLDGSTVFGAISEPVRGSVDLDPGLTDSTRLADLRGGEGIDPGAISLSDGTNTSIIDLTGAETIGDAADLIRANPPPGRTVDVQITATGLVIQLDAAGGGSLFIREVGDGTTARDLGILSETGVAGPVVGADLDPILRTTTRLVDIFGGAGAGLDLASGLQIRNGSQTYTIDLSTAETVEDLLNLINGSEAGVIAHISEDLTAIDVRSRFSGADFAIGENGGTTATQLGLRTFTDQTRLEDLNFGRGVEDYQGGGNGAFATYGSEMDRSALVLRAKNVGIAWNGFVVDFVDSGGPPGSETLSYDPAAKTITFAIVPGSTTANDLIDLFNVTPGVTNDFEIELAAGDGWPNDGTGLVPLGSATTGGGYSAGADFQITRADGVALEVDITGAETIGEVIDRINTHADNTPLPAGGPGLVARLAVVGNGIELVDNTAGAGSLTVSRLGENLTAIDLGLVPEGQQSSTAGSPVLSGADVRPYETEGIFTALLRLQSALEANDLWTIERSIEILDEQVLRMNFARAELGARQQGLDVMQLRLDDEEVELRQALSLDHDADLAEAISNLTARQVALEASLRTIGELSRITLLDFL